MNAGDVCNREVKVIGPEATLVEAARRMRADHVGDLVVVEEDGDGPSPIGVITDRDIVVEGVAQDLSQLGRLIVGDILTTRPLVVVAEDESLADAVHRMGLHGVRRMPVVDEKGLLVGILTMDDVIGLLAEQTGALAKVVERQATVEKAMRST